MCGRRIDYNKYGVFEELVRGFEQGIADLQPQQREVLFRACAETACMEDRSDSTAVCSRRRRGIWTGLCFRL